MLAYHVPWWMALIGALTPPGTALLFGLGYWFGRRTERAKQEDETGVHYYGKGRP